MLKSVKNQVLDQVWDQVRVQVRDQVWIKSGFKSGIKSGIKSGSSLVSSRGSSRGSSLGSEEGYFKMKTLIVLVFIAFGEPPKVIDVYQIQPGVYQTCKMKAKELNKSAVNGRWDCSLMKKEDLK
jgi:hypothetical protein